MPASDTGTGGTRGGLLRQWVVKTLESLPSGARLPTDLLLAKEWGLDPRTVRGIMSALGREGKLERQRGKGTFKPSERIRESPRVQVDAPERLAAALEEAISQGRLRVGSPLPQVKFLSLQYSVSPRTVTEAYRILQDRGLASRIGKRYWLGGVTGPVTRMSSTQEARELWLVLRHEAHKAQVFDTDILAPSYRRMEAELRLHGIALRLMVLREPRDIAGRTPPLALVFWRCNSTDQAEMEAISAAISTGKGKGPSVLFDIANYKGRTRISSTVQVLLRGELTYAQVRGFVDYLQGRHLTKIALVLDRDRMRNDLSGSLLRYGKLVYGVNPYLPEGGIFHLLAVGSDETVDTKWVGNALNEPDSRNYLAYLKRKYQHKISKQNWLEASQLYFFSDMMSACNEYPGHVLYICTSDALAVKCLDTLSAQKRNVPEDAEVISLEQTTLGLQHGLSVCVPDLDLLGYLMTHALLGDIPIRKTSRGYIQVPNAFVERFTTGPQGGKE